MKKHIKIVVLILMMSCVLLFYLYKQGFFLPSYIQWNTKTIEEDCNQDGYIETIQLQNKHVTIQFEQSKYSFDSHWFISDIALKDMDQDGTKELVMLVWNQMNYGDYTPFWEENDTFSFSQHLYLFTIQEDSIHSKWMSSRLRPNIKEWKINEDASLSLLDPDGEWTQWIWNQFGFERIN